MEVANSRGAGSATLPYVSVLSASASRIQKPVAIKPLTRVNKNKRSNLEVYDSSQLSWQNPPECDMASITIQPPSEDYPACTLAPVPTTAPRVFNNSPPLASYRFGGPPNPKNQLLLQHTLPTGTAQFDAPFSESQDPPDQFFEVEPFVWHTDGRGDDSTFF
jgi:hypothetical protein